MNTQKIKDHLISCVTGFALGLIAGAVYVLKPIPALFMGVLLVGMFAFGYEKAKGWRFLSYLFGTLISGAVGMALLLWLDIPVPPL